MLFFPNLLHFLLILDPVTPKTWSSSSTPGGSMTPKPVSTHFYSVIHIIDVLLVFSYGGNGSSFVCSSQDEICLRVDRVAWMRSALWPKYHQKHFFPRSAEINFNLKERREASEYDKSQMKRSFISCLSIGFLLPRAADAICCISEVCSVWANTFLILLQLEKRKTRAQAHLKTIQLRHKLPGGVRL